MNFFYLFAEETAETAAKGFGLNLDIPSTNLFNIVIVLGLLIYLARGFLTRTLGERRQELETSIKEVEKRASEAETQLQAARKNLSTAQAQAQQILSEAQQNAQRLRQQILDQAQLDIAKVKESVDKDLQNEQQRILTQVRLKVVQDALARLQQTLPGELDEQTQSRLLDQSIQQVS